LASGLRFALLFAALVGEPELGEATNVIGDFEEGTGEVETTDFPVDKE